MDSPIDLLLYAKMTWLLFLLLNPFLMGGYLITIIKNLSLSDFTWVLMRASVISACIFILFGIFGEFIFVNVFQTRFAAFQIFGGIVFLVIGIRFMLQGVNTLAILRGPVKHLAGAIAMPFMIGPGTVSASVLIGTKLGPFAAALSVCLALLMTVMTLLLFKLLHDYLKAQQESLLDRYLEIIGRVNALFIGTYAIEMIMQGTEKWLTSVIP